MLNNFTSSNSPFLFSSVSSANTHLTTLKILLYFTIISFWFVSDINVSFDCLDTIHLIVTFSFELILFNCIVTRAFYQKIRHMFTLLISLKIIFKSFHFQFYLFLMPMCRLSIPIQAILLMLYSDSCYL